MQQPILISTNSNLEILSAGMPVSPSLPGSGANGQGNGEKFSILDGVVFDI